MHNTMVAMGLIVVGGAIGLVAAQNLGGPQGAMPFPGPGRLVGAIDANHDGTISAAEIASAAAALKTLDANGDGRLTADELRPAGRRGGEPAEGPSASSDDLTDTLMAFDDNHNGTLERAEVPGRFQALFDRADADKNGVLTRDEIKQSAAAEDQARPGARGDREGRGPGRGVRGMFGMDRVFAALDVDHDGTLSAEEIAGAPAALKTLDTNNDGQLTADEFRPNGRGRAGFGRMRGPGDGR